MSVRMRQTKGQTGSRRSHHRVSVPQLSACASCGGEHVRHTACLHCGNYRGRQVFDMAAVHAKREAKKAQKRETMQEERGGHAEHDHTQVQDSTAPANAEVLSHTDEGSKRA